MKTTYDVIYRMKLYAPGFISPKMSDTKMSDPLHFSVGGVILLPLRGYMPVTGTNMLVLAMKAFFSGVYVLQMLF